MTHKILTYMSGERGHVFFASLSFLQKKMPCEIYGIIDRNESVKKFFQKQKFVNFKELFYYRDSIKRIHDPDYEYLKNFEKKHNVNLWSIAYMDPAFYKYDEQTHFSEREILSLIEDDCRFFENIFSKVKPDFLILHVGGMKQLNLLERMVDYYGTKRLVFSGAKFGPRHQISKNYELIDHINIEKNNGDETEPISNKEIDETRKKLELYNFYKKKVKEAPQLKKTNYLLATLTALLDHRREFYNQYSNIKKNFFISNFELFLKQIKKYQRKKYLDKVALYHVPDKTKFIFFPLHSQPEQTLSVRAQYYTNQLSLIKNIAQSIPIDYTLYVKEHYFMGILYKWRTKSYYDKLLEMPNVKLIHPSVPSSELYEKCDLVVTINGSATYESLLYRKPVIVFTDTSSMMVPMVTKVLNLEDLPKIIREKLSLKNDTKQFKQYFKAKMDESFYLEQSLFHQIFNEFFIHAGSVDNISNSQMEQFLEKNKNTLEFIADRLLLKIKQYQSNQIT